MLANTYEQKKQRKYCHERVFWLFFASINAPLYDFFVVIMSCLLSDFTTTFNHEIYSIRQAMTHNVCPCKFVIQVFPTGAKPVCC